MSGASALYAGNVGLFGNGPIAQNLNLQIELSASLEGENYLYADANTSLDGSYKFTYLNLPVLLQPRIYKGLYAETGPQFGLLLNATSQANYSGFSSSGTPGFTSSSDYSSYVKTLAFGWDFGLAYKFSSLIAINARYDLGIVGLGSKQAYPNNNHPNYRNSVFSFNLLLSPFKRHFNKKK
jgi:hypothetical protein